MTAAITFYDIVLWIHVLAAVVAFGSVFAYPVLLNTIGRSDALGAFHAGQVVVWSRVVTPAMVVVLLAGAYLATDAEAWSEPWVSGTLVVLFVLFGIVGAMTGVERRAAEVAVGGGPGYDAVVVRLRRMDAVAALLVVVAVFLMVVKPG
jgi:uncharacterized membrane protein